MPCWGWNPGLSAFKSDSKRKFPSPRYATESSFSGVLGRFPSFPNNRSVCASCPQHSWSMAAGVPHCTRVCWSDVRPGVGVPEPPFVSWALVCSGSEAAKLWGLEKPWATLVSSPPRTQGGRPWRTRSSVALPCDGNGCSWAEGELWLISAQVLRRMKVQGSSERGVEAIRLR